MRKAILKIFKVFGISSLIFLVSLFNGPTPVFADTISDTYADNTKINASSSSGYILTGGIVKLTYNTLGTGADGDVVLSSAKNINTDIIATGRSTYADGVTYGVSAISTNTVTAAATPNGIAANDNLILINMQGDATNNANVGTYEFLAVQSVSVNTITFTSNITGTYGVGGNSDLTGQKIIIQRVPNYRNVTICAGNNSPAGVGCTAAGSITASAWGGTTGGLLIFKVNGTFTLAGTLNANALGYRGGTGGTGAAGGQNGESFDGYNGAGGTNSGAQPTAGGGRAGSQTPSPNDGAARGGGGGGGGGDANSDVGAGGGGAGAGYAGGGGGGGGGGNAAGAGGSSGAAGVSAGGGGAGNNNSAGGAGGTAPNAGGSTGQPGGEAGNGAISGSGGSGAGNANYGAGGGGGGGIYGTANLTNLYLGSGGGGGGGDQGLNQTGKNGGIGGGIIFVAANDITISGGATSTGANGVQSTNAAGSSGAGSGGSIFFRSMNVLTPGTGLVTSNGGTGGTKSTYGGGGGNGSIGRIAVEYLSSTSGTTTPSANSTQITGTYLTSATIISTNLLTGVTGIDSIDEFQYNLSSKPANTTATVQFSQDGTNWYNSSNSPGGTDTLTTGTNNTISIHALGWSTAYFYYKVAFTGDGTATPTLDDVAVNYTTAGYTATPTSGQDTYDNYSSIDTSTSTNANYLVDGRLILTPPASIVGGGADGDIVVSASKNINTDTIAAGRSYADGVNYSVDALGTNTITTMTPAGWWKMDEVANGTCTGGKDECDSSPNANDGTGTIPTIGTGQYGNARVFNGTTANISVADSTSLHVGGTFTIEAWVEPTSLAARYGVFSTRVNNAAGGWQLEVGTGNGGTARVSVTGLNTWIFDSVNSVITAGVWTHIAYVRTSNSDTGTLYVNGVSKAGTTASYTITDNTDNKMIGEGTSSTQRFPGSIDDVRLYNYARTQPQVVSDMNYLQSPNGIVAGDEILLMNMQGDATNNGNVGNYEFLTVQSVSERSITTTTNIANTYGVGGNSNLAGQRIMVQRVPNYRNVIICAGNGSPAGVGCTGAGTITANTWDGTTGGVVAFYAKGAITNAGTIDVKGKGYRGGPGTGSTEAAGYQGESKVIYAISTAANLGGGGGGDNHLNSGGQGGGGCGGGFGAVGTAGGASSDSVTCTAGGIYGDAALNQLNLGSGGGGGGFQASVAGGSPGGNGGGAVLISASTITITGSISANGNDGTSSGNKAGPGGGGSGGSIKLIGKTIDVGSSIVTATAGAGGTGTGAAGGAGAVGRIAIQDETVSGTANPAANASALTLTYTTSATIQSINLLSGVANIQSINSLAYSMTSLPSGASATIQFSQDKYNWYNSSVSPGGTDTMSSGTNTISLSSLSWSGPYFYYKIVYTGDGNVTPLLDSVTVNYTTNTPSAGTSWSECRPFPGGDFTVSQDCYFPNTRFSSPLTNVDGVDNGNLTISAYKTLTVRGDQIIARNNKDTNSGKGVLTLSTGSSIAINDLPVGAVGGNVRDYSGGDGEGQAVGSTIVAGKYGTARSFNGTSDYIDILNPAPFNFERTNSFSVSFWMKTSTSANAAIISKSNGTAGWEIVQPSADATKVQLNLMNTSGSNEIRKRSSVSVNTGQWVHVGITYDGSSTANGVKIYINGTLDSSASNVADALNASIQNTTDLNIGARAGVAPLYNGTLDDIRIYNYVRSDTQVTEDMNYFPNPTGNGPVAWYRFEDGGEIKETNLWVKDINGDGWYLGYGNAQRAQTASPGTGWVRRNATIGPLFGDGRDGNVTITAATNFSTLQSGTRTCADAISYNLTGFGTTSINSIYGQGNVTTATTSTSIGSGCFSTGDDILLINLQGVSGNTVNVGNYEMLKVYSASGSTITFTTAKTKYYGTGATDDYNLGTATTNQRVVAQRIPQYNSFTVNSGVTLNVNGWNAGGTGGTKDGIIAFRANTVNISGTISASALGYIGGGGGGQNGNNPGINGESYDGIVGAGGTTTGNCNATPNGGSRGSKGPSSSDPGCSAGTRGGGGGSGVTSAAGGSPASAANSWNSGGGGGGGYGGGGGGGGGGNWSTSYGAGGSGGAFGTSGGGGGGATCGQTNGETPGDGGAAGVTGQDGVNNYTCTSGYNHGLGGAAGATAGSTGGSGGTSNATGGGGGGGSYGVANLSKIYFGSGGGGTGAGQASGGGFAGRTGGAGGGIIIIQGNTITVNTGASIQANGGTGGTKGTVTGPAGNGAGGSILLSANTISAGTNLVTAPLSGANDTNAGGGGDGVIAISANTITGTTNPTYNPNTAP